MTQVHGCPDRPARLIRAASSSIFARATNDDLPLQSMPSTSNFRLLFLSACGCSCFAPASLYGNWLSSPRYFPPPLPPSHHPSFHLSAKHTHCPNPSFRRKHSGTPATFCWGEKVSLCVLEPYAQAPSYSCGITPPLTCTPSYMRCLRRLTLIFFEFLGGKFDRNACLSYTNLILSFGVLGLPFPL